MWVFGIVTISQKKWRLDPQISFILKDFQEGEEESVSSESDDETEDGQETNDDEAKKSENYEEKEEAELRQVERMV